MKKSVITLKEYQGFQRAYDFFNRELFAGSLPQVLVTLQRHANTRGYFSPERFHGRIGKAAVHELALNPDSFTGRTDEMILSTLAHEMAHKPRQCLLYVYASLSRLDFQGFFENAILVFPGITGFPLSKKPTALMMHW